MANPNIVNVTTINGLTVANTPSTNSATVLVNNPASSGQLFKINTLIATNMAGANTVINCTAAYNNGSNGVGISYPISNTISVPSSASLIVIDKSSALYLTENTSITVTSSSSNSLSFVCSYEVIS